MHMIFNIKGKHQELYVILHGTGVNVNQWYKYF